MAKISLTSTSHAIAKYMMWRGHRVLSICPGTGSCSRVRTLADVRSRRHESRSCFVFDRKWEGVDVVVIMDRQSFAIGSWE
jgi:predicted CoA-binding protein